MDGPTPHPRALVSTPDLLAAIARHSEALAEAASVDLAASVRHCPGWSVADLVAHVVDVHWFWATIARERLLERPEESRRPPRPDDAALVGALRDGATHLVQVLGDADQGETCWTWAGWQQDVAFVTRHQVQEAAVHHWDAAHAVGQDWSIGSAVAVDSIDEFLHFSVASEDDPDDPVTPPLQGSFALHARDTGHTWVLTDGRHPGTVRVRRPDPTEAHPGTPAGVPVVSGDAADLLLWLYQRHTTDGAVDLGGLPADLLARFRGVCFTD